jgi:hypothetical protein
MSYNQSSTNDRALQPNHSHAHTENDFFSKFLYNSFSSFYTILTKEKLDKLVDTSLTVKPIENGFEGLPETAKMMLREANPSVIDLSQILRYELTTFTFLKYTVNLYIAYTMHIPQKKRIVSYICLFLWLLDRAVAVELSSVQPVQTHLNIVLTSFDTKRMLPKERSFEISRVNVNGGMQYTSFLIVYRRQEFFKVLLHEMMHFFKFDASLHSHQVHDIERLLCQKYGIISSRLALNESFNDFMTCTFVNGLLSYKPKMRYNSFRKVFLSNLQIESNHMVSRCAAIVRHFKLLPMFPFPYGKFKEETHVFSYYFCKAALFMNIDAFERWMVLNNNGSFRLDDHVNVSYCNFVCSCLDSSNFMPSVSIQYKKGHRLSTTLRMMKNELR